MLKGAIAQMLAMAGGSINTLFPAGKSERKEKNPNTPESQYLIARAEEKRERRAAALNIVAAGTAPYNTTDYFAGRAAIRVKVAEANELRRVGIETGTISKLDQWGGIAKWAGRVSPRKPKKNAVRKLRAAY